MKYNKMKKRVMVATALLFILPNVFAKEITYPENLHGGVYIRSDYVPTPCQVNACNAVSIEMMKEFFDNLNDSNREYIDFDLYPAKLQRIAREEHSSLSYSMFDMTTVVKNDINQKKLAEVVNTMSQFLKSYYKANDKDKNLNIRVQFSITASKEKTVIQIYSLRGKEQTEEQIRSFYPKQLASLLEQYVLHQKKPIITESPEEITIKFENSYITNSYNYLKNPQ